VTKTLLTLPAILRYDFKPATTTVGEQWVRNAGNLKAILGENQIIIVVSAAKSVTVPLYHKQWPDA
jgi:hypothetical protein